VQAHVRAERARMSRVFLDHGCEGVLSSLGPAFHWRAPVLEASQHAAVLRDAGLIVTRRQGGCVLHFLTPVGVALLAGPAAA
jgi:hypothetical protein